MNKKDLVIRLAEKVRITTPLSIECVDALMDIMAEAFVNGENIYLRDFGSFSVIQSKQRIGQNFHTGESILIPPQKKIKFIPSKEIKNRLNSTD